MPRRAPRILPLICRHFDVKSPFGYNVRMANRDLGLEIQNIESTAVARTIPNQWHSWTSDGTPDAIDLADPAGDGSKPSMIGRWVEFRAEGGTVTLRRDDAAITAGQGLTLLDGERDERFIRKNPDGDGAEDADVMLQWAASNGIKLFASYDSETP